MPPPTCPQASAKRPHRSGFSRRGGFSLLEMIVASGILLACLVVLGRLAAEGRHHVDDIENLSQAQLACQTRLNELLCGAHSLEAVENEPLAELPGWAVSVSVEPLQRSGVSAVRVTVAKERDEEASGLEDRPLGPQFTLVRWVRDPQATALPEEPQP